MHVLFRRLAVSAPYFIWFQFIFENKTLKKTSKLLFNKKQDYFFFAVKIANNPITDATTEINGDNGACVVEGLVINGAVVVIVETVVTGADVCCSVTVVAKGTGAEFPRWEVLPVLKIVSVPNWFDTESLTS